MKCYFLFLPLISAVLATAASDQVSPSESTQNENENEKAIGQVLAASVEAWNHHDAKAFSMTFAEDADFTNVVGMSAHGRAEIEKFHAPMFASNFKDSNLKMTGTKIRFIRPDIAAVDAWWELTGARGADGQEIPMRKGLLNFLMTRQSGQWFITVMHNMDLPQK